MNKLFKAILSIMAMCIVILIVALKASKKDDTVDLLSYHPVVRTIVDYRLISGIVVPGRQIALKPQITGILEKLYVKEGAYVVEGTPIARVRLLANPNTVEVSEKAVAKAQNDFDIAKSNHDRNKSLFDEKVISASEYEGFKNKYDDAQQDLNSAIRQLQIARDGFAEGKKQVSNIVYSTISGTVLELPLTEGSSVIERNTFNDGSTVAVIADMKNIIFKAKVPEKDIGYLKKGMLFHIALNAVNGQQYAARISMISSQGSVENNVTSFDVESEVEVNEDSLIVRSGYTAVAKIILSKKEKVLSIEEKYLHYNGDSAYVFINAGNEKSKAWVKTGISDGVWVEIPHGLSAASNIFIGIGLSRGLIMFDRLSYIDIS